MLQQFERHSQRVCPVETEIDSAGAGVGRKKDRRAPRYPAEDEAGGIKLGGSAMETHPFIDEILGGTQKRGCGIHALI